MDLTDLPQTIAACTPLIHPRTAQAIIAVESSFNPNAIGVVGGRLTRQPRTRAEAVATALRLELDGWNFSLGLAQINRASIDRLGLGIEQVLDPCTNLRAMQAVLLACFERAGPSSPDAQGALRKALSCYYSGDFRTGFAHGYVQRAVRAASAP